MLLTFIFPKQKEGKDSNTLLSFTLTIMLNMTVANCIAEREKRRKMYKLWQPLKST